MCTEDPRRREREYDDDPDPEYFDEMEETYRDGSMKNECWNEEDRSGDDHD